MFVSEEEKVAVIGAGISGLSVARMLSARHSVTVYEGQARPGGLVQCDMERGILYHKVGGHVFNSRRKDVLDWFWKQFSPADFHKAKRRAVVAFQDFLVDYPIENHLYQMPETMRESVLGDLLSMTASGCGEADNFDAFLRNRFGSTLYEAYFGPYNRKIWRRPLADVPLSWLEGKLPMPTVRQILSANIAREQEMSMVHSTFLYPLRGGSQFLADTLASGLELRLNTPVETVRRLDDGMWNVCGEIYSRVIYTGDARQLPRLLRGEALVSDSDVAGLECHGTTSVLCEVDPNPYSWVYLPDPSHEAHRIICTGNFSPHNAPAGKHTATVEFSGEMDRNAIESQLGRLPFHPRCLAHSYAACTYPIQKGGTRERIAALKGKLGSVGFHLLGRFAEWEYYNMDAAMGAAMDFVRSAGL